MEARRPTRWPTRWRDRCGRGGRRGRATDEGKVARSVEVGRPAGGGRRSVRHGGGRRPRRWVVVGCARERIRERDKDEREAVGGIFFNY